jgi:hypothetical protein
LYSIFKEGLGFAARCTTVFCNTTVDGHEDNLLSGGVYSVTAVAHSVAGLHTQSQTEDRLRYSRREDVRLL